MSPMLVELAVNQVSGERNCKKRTIQGEGRREREKNGGKVEWSVTHSGWGGTVGGGAIIDEI